MTETVTITNSPDSSTDASREGGPKHTTRVSIDTHVHLYPRYDVTTFLDAAASSLAEGSGDVPDRTIGCLMLTEAAGHDGYCRLQTEGPFGGWTVASCSDGLSLRVTRGDDVLLVIAGRQVVTQGRLEVLALGTRAEIADGQSVDATIEQSLEAGALPVLPYALGKWMGPRGEVIAQAVERWADKGVCVGDNACRPWGLPAPSVFKRARMLGVPVLPGSDPLDIPGGELSAGRYGVVVETEIDHDAPAAGVKQVLRDASANAGKIGGRVSPWRCVLQQVALRRHKREKVRP